MDREKLVAYWAYKQGLFQRSENESPHALFSRVGWARSIAGCNPYLTAFSRSGLGRKSLEDAVANLEISELPSARSCTYVVPKSDFQIALAMADSAGEGEARLAKSFGMTEEELQSLGNEILTALEYGPMDPAELKRQLGPAVRNFGEEGKKKGLTTSLPVALGQLQTQGKIVRRPLSGRLDEQRYAYAQWRQDPPDVGAVTREQALKSVAEKFFNWSGLATHGQFAVFAGISQGTAKESCAQLGLKSVGAFEGYWCLPEVEAEFETFRPPDEPIYRLLNCLDSHLLLRDGLNHLFTESGVADFKKITPVKEPIRELGFNPITDRGTIVGLWEFDPEVREIVYASFGKMDSALSAEIKSTQTFISEQLGDARTSSLDSPKSRKPRIEILRRASSITNP